MEKERTGTVPRTRTHGTPCWQRATWTELSQLARLLAQRPDALRRRVCCRARPSPDQADCCHWCRRHCCCQTLSVTCRDTALCTGVLQIRVTFLHL